MAPLSSDHCIGKTSFIWPDHLSRKENVNIYLIIMAISIGYIENIDKKGMKMHIQLLITPRLRSERHKERICTFHFAKIKRNMGWD